MSKLKLAVIDDGIHPLAAEGEDISYWSVRREAIPRQIDGRECCTRRDSHGTRIFQLIRGCLSTPVSWQSIQVLNPVTGQGNQTDLLNALELCLELGVKLIHLSIGSSWRGDCEAIRRCVKRLAGKGCILVAAASNREIAAYPACLPEVIGVRWDPGLHGEEYKLCRRPLDGIDFLASASRLVQGNGELWRPPPGNSFAAPLITAKAACFLAQHPGAGLADVYSALNEGALNRVDVPDTYYLPRVEAAVQNGLLLHIFSSDAEDTAFEGIRPSFPCRQYSVPLESFQNTRQSLRREEADWILLNFCGTADGWEQAVELVTESTNVPVAVFPPAASFHLTAGRIQHSERVWLYEDFQMGAMPCGNEVGCPVILFEGFSPSRLLLLLQRVSRLFEGDGYYCRTASGIPWGELLGFDVMPPSGGLPDYIRGVCSYYQCDVLLLGSSVPLRAGEGLVDIRVDYSSPTGGPRPDGEPARLFYGNGDGGDLYRQILDLLS